MLQLSQFFVTEQAELLSISLAANCNILSLPRKMEILIYKKVPDNHQLYRNLTVVFSTNRWTVNQVTMMACSIIKWGKESLVSVLLEPLKKKSNTQGDESLGSETNGQTDGRNIHQGLLNAPAGATEHQEQQKGFQGRSTICSACFNHPSWVSAFSHCPY